MRTFCLLIIGLTLFGSCSHHHIMKGNAAYEEMAYTKAAKSYEKALSIKEKPEIHAKAGMAYERMNLTTEAEKHYGLALQSDEFAESEYKYKYAQMLMENGKQEEALDWMRKYVQDHPADSSAQEWLSEKVQEGEYAEYAPSRVAVEVVPLVGYTAAFGALPGNGGVYFVGEKVPEKSDKVNPWNGQSFLDVYYAEEVDKNEWVSPVVVEGELNSFLHDGPFSLDENGQIAYVTRSAISSKNRHKLDDDKINQLKIVRFGLESDGKWKYVDDLPFNLPESSTMHPSISKSGNTLYFASDREGGYGGTDLYAVTYNGQEWSEPQNLGKEINTNGNEVFPFSMHGDTLFFSSDGHGGMGGLDVFISIFDGKEWTHPKNLKAPINTHYDDFSFYRQDDGMKGYFSSNRNGKDEIYTWDVTKPEFLLVGVVLDFEDIPVTDADVVLREGDIPVDSVKTNSTGKFSIPLEGEKDYTVSGESETEKTDTVFVSTVGKTESETMEVELKLEDPEFWVHGIVVDRNTQARLQDVKVELLANEVLIDSIQSDKKGEFLFKLDIDVAYKIYGVRKNHFTRKVDVSTVGLKKSTTFEVTLELEKVVVEQTIVLNNIYYDYDKSNIRKDAVGDLDNLARFMTDNTGAQIELSAHTDSRGTNAYNMTLSTARAESAMNYLIEHGINADRIKYKGYGETKPVNECKDGVKCSEEKHQENRRTEFKVLKLEM